LAEFPPTLILTGELDTLCSEMNELAPKMAAESVAGFSLGRARHRDVQEPPFFLLVVSRPRMIPSSSAATIVALTVSPLRRPSSLTARRGFSFASPICAQRTDLAEVASEWLTDLNQVVERQHW
jgi:hypothetical protein